MVRSVGVETNKIASQNNFVNQTLCVASDQKQCVLLLSHSLVVVGNYLVNLFSSNLPQSVFSELPVLQHNINWALKSLLSIYVKQMTTS
jgi:hypothetical protein